MEYEIHQISSVNLHLLENLAEEAQEEGFRFVRRTIDEWQSELNDFSKAGEVLLGIFKDDVCIGLGGLNIDPYLEDKNTGRIRHLYIANEYRRRGIAGQLVRKLIGIAREHFVKLRLFTNNSAAALFYEELGFETVNEFKASHVLPLL